MLKNYQNIVDLTPAELHRFVDQIGHTPLLSIHLVFKEQTKKIHLKLESANPTGSMKDRTSYALMRYLDSHQLLNKESVIIESTSGNLGVALAFQCKAQGYPFVAVIDPKTPRESIARMKAFGAHVDMVHQADITGGYLLSRLARMHELCALHQNYVWTDQYSNPANPHIHYACTGPEIYQQMNGKVGAVFVPASTGGTLAGIGQFFREVSPSTQIVGVDAYGSIIFGTPPAPRKLTGIGSSRRSTFIRDDLYDTFLLIKDEEAFSFCRALSVSTNIKVGGSSGAVLAACAKYLIAHPTVDDVVCVCADNGENYASSIFNDEWLQEQGLALSKEHLCLVEAIVY